MKTNWDFILKQLKGELSNLINDKQGFICIYGSFCNKKLWRNSDIDLIIALPEYTREEGNILIKKVIKLHQDKKLFLDNEVPYQNKLVYSFDELVDSISCRGLKVIKNKIIIPRVEKNNLFLSSKEVKYRLAFNAFTTPNIFIGESDKKYLELRELAEQNLFLLTLCLINQNNITLDYLVESLFKNRDGDSDEMYLGYHNNSQIRRYVGRIIKNQIENFLSKGYFQQKPNNQLLLKNKELVTEFINKINNSI